MKCPKCEFENPGGMKFCGECGRDLAQPTKAASMDCSVPQSYTPKFLAEKILTSRDSIEGERKLVTVLFADVANYTSLSGKLDPEDVYQVMDGCFRILMDEIHRHEGTINQFTGDGVMALFGAPVAHEDHIQRACHASLAIQKAMADYGERIREHHGVEFRMRIGLNSGPVIVGAIGDDLRMDYTAVGDTTNLASRMQTKARPSTVLVSERTHEVAKDFFEFKPRRKLKVKGIEEPQNAYELVRALEVETRFQAAVAKGLTKFVGREEEMQALQEAFQIAQSGSGQVVGIAGEAGVGKSRILLELREMLPKEEYTYLEGRCLHYGGSMPYLPLLDMLRSCLDIKEGDREPIVRKTIEERLTRLDEKLKDAVPPLHDILSLTVEDEEYLQLGPQQKRERTFEAIRDLLVRESQNMPLIIAVEDLHWIDRTSEEFLTYLIGFLANTRILLALLYRPEYTHQWSSKSYYRGVNVDQLSSGTSAELVQTILEDGEVVPELRELILYRASGNPLFMEEFTHNLVQNGTIQKEGHQYVLGRQASEVQVPETIQGIIAARMDRLEDDIKRTMQVASVIGRDFAFRILHTITGMQDELKSYLLDLQRLEFIYEKSLFPELEYIFKHALIQEVAYDSVLTKRRRKLHERIGEAIEELYADRLEELYEMLAHHYSRSENLEKAYQYLKLSAEKAIRKHSLWEAFRSCRQAIIVLDREANIEDNKAKQIEVRLLMTGAMSALGGPEDSLEILQQGEKLSQELGDERSLAIFHSSMGNLHTLRGDSLRGLKYAEKAFQEARKIQDVDLAAPIAFDLCAPYNISGEYFRIVEVAPSVIALIEKQRKQSESFGKGLNVHSYLLGNYGAALGFLGRFTEGQALCEKALRYAMEAEDLFSVVVIENNYGWMFNFKGEASNAVEHLQNGAKCSEEAQMPVLFGLLNSGLGWAHYLAGEPMAAREHAERAIKFQSDTGIPFLLSSAYSTLSVLHLDSGDLEEARRCAEEALRLSQNNNEKWAEGVSRVLMGRVVGRTDGSQRAEAEEHVLQGIKIFDELKLKPWRAQGYLHLGELCADMGQQGKALENVKRAQGMFQEMGMDYWVHRTQGVLERVQR